MKDANSLGKGKHAVYWERSVIMAQRIHVVEVSTHFAARNTVIANATNNISFWVAHGT